jgi:hypothetical protein
MTSLISIINSSLLLVVIIIITVAQNGAVAATSAVGGRSSNFRGLLAEPTYSPTDGGQFASGADDDFTYDYNDDVDGPVDVEPKTSATATSGNNDELVAPAPSPNKDNAAPTGSGSSGTPPPAVKCSFCEEGMIDLELVPPGIGGKNCAEVKGYADENLNGTDVCTNIIAPVQSACCPQSLPSEGAGVPPEVGGSAAAEDEVTGTTKPADGGDDNAEVSTTPTPEIIGGDDNNADNTTTAATPSAASQVNVTTAAPAASQVNVTTAAPAASSLGDCILSAENEGKEDPLFTCCANYPEEGMCVLNSCMDFESEVITCQCKKVKGIGNDVLHGDEQLAGYLPEDFGDFLDTFRKCCPSKDTSPAEFNDCYYQEISEEIIEEIEQEFEGDPTYKPTPRPTSAYTPISDDEDPISKEGAEDFSNGQKDDSFQGVINTYLDGVESADEMKTDKNVQVVAVSLVVVFLVLLLLTAHLVMEHPDGLCASFCRLILKCLCCGIRVLCLPCRAICCKGSDQTRSRRTHAPMRAPFPSDLELA